MRKIECNFQMILVALGLKRNPKPSAILPASLRALVHKHSH